MVEPIKTWQVQDARARFGDVIDAALRGEPQRISRRGKSAVVVVSEEEWKRLARPQPRMTFGELLAGFPLTPEEWSDVKPPRHRPRKSAFQFEE